jgi:hypothetical protein
LVLQERNETGLMVSWFTTPIACALFASASQASLGDRLSAATIAGAILSVLTAIVTFAVWWTWAEPWMRQQSGIVIVVCMVTVGAGIIGSALLSFLLPPRASRKSDTLQ